MKKEKVLKKRIKDLPPDVSLAGVKFRIPGTRSVGYWYSQWGYTDGKAGVWYKKDMASGAVYPIFLDNLKDALEWEVVDGDGDSV